MECSPTPRRSTPIAARAGPRPPSCWSGWSDLVAVEVGKDPAEVRRINLIPKFDNGHDVCAGLTYDSGDYEAALDMALDHVGYSGLREEQAHAREHGNYVGIGVSTYCEICGLGPSQVAGAVGFGGGLWESAVVRFHPTGKVNAYVGVSPHGQGEETTFAQVVSDTLGVPVDDVEIVHGDTDNTPMGWGTYGSRTTAVGAGALLLGLNKIKDKARALAAHLLEAAEADIEYADGQFYVRGAPDQAKSIQEIALMANVAWNMPEGMEPGLEASAFYDPPNFVYPFGAHVAVVDVDTDKRPRRASPLRGSGRLRPADQPHDRRGTGPRRRGAGCRAGPLGGRGLQR